MPQKPASARCRRRPLQTTLGTLVVAGGDLHLLTLRQGVRTGILDLGVPFLGDAAQFLQVRASARRDHAAGYLVVRLEPDFGRAVVIRTDDALIEVSDVNNIRLEVRYLGLLCGIDLCAH